MDGLGHFGGALQPRGPASLFPFSFFFSVFCLFFFRRPCLLTVPHPPASAAYR